MADVVLDKRQRRAEDEAVHPQAQACQFDRKWVQIHAINAALEQHAFDDLRIRWLVRQVEKGQLLGDFFAFFGHETLQRLIVRQALQRQVGEVAQRFDQKVAAAAGVIEHAQAGQRPALCQRMVNTRLDQPRCQHRRCVVAGAGFARVAGAFQVDPALFDADFAKGTKALVFADEGGVVGIEIGFDGFALGGGAAVFKVGGGFMRLLEAEFEQSFIDAAQVGHAHGVEVARSVKQGLAALRFVEQLLQYLAQTGVAEDFWRQQQGGAGRVEQAAVEQRDVDVLRAFVEHLEQFFEVVYAVELVTSLVLPGPQAAVKAFEAVALVEGVRGQQFAVAVFKIDDEQQAKQQDDGVFVKLLQRGVLRSGHGLVRLPDAFAHVLEQRIFAIKTVDDGLEVFFNCQCVRFGGCNGLFDGADGGAGHTGLRRWRIGVAPEEKGKQRQRAVFFCTVRQVQHLLQIHLQVSFARGDFACVVQPPMPPVGEHAKAHPQRGEVIHQLVVRVVCMGLAGVERFVPRLGFANGGHVLQGLVRFAAGQGAGSRGIEREAPVRLGLLALHGVVHLWHGTPAHALQQRPDEAMLQLRFVGVRQLGHEVLRQPVCQPIGQGLVCQLSRFLIDKAGIKQVVDQPRMGKEVSSHARNVTVAWGLAGIWPCRQTPAHRAQNLSRRGAMGSRLRPDEVGLA